MPTAQPSADPVALKAFLERREVCDHLRGEIPEPGDQEAIDEVIASINKYCDGTDAELARLKRAHGGDATVKKQLDALEPCIEQKSRCRGGVATR
ncbi:hypothetical protein OU995_16850 [Roseateles sp. SL47]|uniref:hypothetical protein n=1 Tax=Roseateles sp. SL47 TaxID=2995138 RepID=UPI00227008C9|nr:hypothetical protein [Roseateles sp. SL47]WAC71254.1 hypothetical protein OU995_16850 [Roseateles sp. SL47]